MALVFLYIAVAVAWIIPTAASECTTTTTAARTPEIPFENLHHNLASPLFDDSQSDSVVSSSLPKNNHQQALSASSSSSARILQPTPPQQGVPLLFHGGYGLHYVHLWCGSPPQRQTVRVATGTLDYATGFPCRTSSSAPTTGGTTASDDGTTPPVEADVYFITDQSSTYQRLSCGSCLAGECDDATNTCPVERTYSQQDGLTFQGVEGRDGCYLGGRRDKPVEEWQALGRNDPLDPLRAAASAFTAKFGCEFEDGTTTTTPNLFQHTSTDGILAMSNDPVSYWRQAHDAGVITQQAFSLCFRPQDIATLLAPSPPTTTDDPADIRSIDAGIMVLGGTDVRLHNTPMVYSLNDRDRSFGARVRQVYLRPSDGSRPVSLDLFDSFTVFVDTGTPFTSLSQSIDTVFSDTFLQITNERYRYIPQSFTLAEIEAMPTILIQLQGDETANEALVNQIQAETPNTAVQGLAGTLDRFNPYDVILEIPPTQYMQYDPQEGMWTTRFFPREATGGVLGGNSLMGYDVLFDVDNRRLGWARADCGYNEILARYGLTPSDDTLQPSTLPSLSPSITSSTRPTQLPSWIPSPLPTINATDNPSLTPVIVVEESSEPSMGNDTEDFDEEEAVVEDLMMEFYRASGYCDPNLQWLVSVIMAMILANLVFTLVLGYFVLFPPSPRKVVSNKNNNKTKNLRDKNGVNGNDHGLAPTTNGTTVTTITTATPKPREESTKARKWPWRRDRRRADEGSSAVSSLDDGSLRIEDPSETSAAEPAEDSIDRAVNYLTRQPSSHRDDNDYDDDDDDDEDLPCPW